MFSAHIFPHVMQALELPCLWSEADFLPTRHSLLPQAEILLSSSVRLHATALSFGLFRREDDAATANFIKNLPLDFMGTLIHTEQTNTHSLCGREQREFFLPFV